MSGRPRTPRRGARGGFTLVELLIGTILAGIFAIALHAFFLSGLDTSRAHESHARAQADARSALDRVARDLRQAVSPDDGATPPLLSLSPGELVLHVDPRRGPEGSEPRPLRVRYAVAGERLVRERAEPDGGGYGPYGRRETLAEDLAPGSEPVFSAVAGDGAELPSVLTGEAARAAAAVSVRLRLGRRTGLDESVVDISTDVALRNPTGAG